MPTAIWILVFLAIFMSLSLMASGGLSVDPVLWPIVPIFLLAAVVIAYLRRDESALLHRLSRGGIVVLPLLLLALIPILAVFAYIGSDVRLWQGLLAGLVVVLGWLSTFLFQEERVAQDRRAKEIDLLLALHAEIGNYLAKFQEDNYAERLKEFEELKSNRKKLPLNFIPTQADMVVFPAMLGQMTVVNDVALHWVVQFYTQVTDISAFSNDLRQEKFATVNTRRFKVEQLINLVEMQQTAITLGRIALEAIEEAVPSDRLDAIEAHYLVVKDRLEIHQGEAT